MIAVRSAWGIAWRSSLVALGYIAGLIAAGVIGGLLGFQVSSDQLNTMVTCAIREASCYGARMTGGGFGGCAVALVRSGSAQAFAASVARSYQGATGLAPNIYICAATNGAEVVQGLA